jgi:coenzyme F420-reducing hydrogenase delta subunit
LAEKLLETMGFGEGRTVMYFLSSAEAEKFREAMQTFGESISKLGPNPSRIAQTKME